MNLENTKLHSIKENVICLYRNHTMNTSLGLGQLLMIFKPLSIILHALIQKTNQGIKHTFAIGLQYWLTIKDCSRHHQGFQDIIL